MLPNRRHDLLNSAAMPLIAEVLRRAPQGELVTNKKELPIAKRVGGPTVSMLVLCSYR